MEFTSTTKFHTISQYVSLLVVFSIATTALCVFATNDDYTDNNFPAIFNFGDSNSDTGGMAATTILQIYPPYGETYFHKPAGRVCDGRLIIDFMAQSFGLPYLNPYLDSLGTNFSHGVNFATISASITFPPSVMPQGGFSPFYLDVQYTQFEKFKAFAKLVRDQGGEIASLMPKDKDFGEALYTFDIGHNDLNMGFIGNMTIPELIEFIPSIIDGFSKNVKNIYNSGARLFSIHNAGPIGCLPYILTEFISAERDKYGCAKLYNDVTRHFNHKLKKAVVHLRKDFPLATFTYVDIFSIKRSLVTNPKKHGFEHPLIACCGYGGKYNFTSIYPCGSTIDVNGTQVFVGSCEDPSVRVIWDGFHYTEAANKFTFDQISTGAFSDPPPPPPNLNKKHHRHSTIKNNHPTPVSDEPLHLNTECRRECTIKNYYNY